MGSRSTLHTWFAQQACPAPLLDLDSTPWLLPLPPVPKAHISDFRFSSLFLYGVWTFLVFLSLALHHNKYLILFYQFYSRRRKGLSLPVWSAIIYLRMCMFVRDGIILSRLPLSFTLFATLPVIKSYIYKERYLSASSFSGQKTC